MQPIWYGFKSEKEAFDLCNLMFMGRWWLTAGFRRYVPPGTPCLNKPRCTIKNLLKTKERVSPRLGWLSDWKFWLQHRGVFLLAASIKKHEGLNNWTLWDFGKSKQIGLNQTKWADLNLAQTFSNPLAERSYLDPPKLGIVSPGRPRAPNDCPHRGMACPLREMRLWIRTVRPIGQQMLPNFW